MTRTGISRRLSLTQMRDQLLSALGPVAPERVAIPAASGAVLAVPVRAPHAMPPQAIALRAGHAVPSLDLVGASAHSPVISMVPPAMVLAGQALPAGCDAVLPPDAVSTQGVFSEITQSPAPGEHVRQAGHDLAAGVLLADSGAILSPHLLLAITLAGVESAEILRPRIALPALAPESVWLAAACAALGCALRAEGERAPAHLALGWSDDAAPLLALHPGETTGIRLEQATPEILLPRRFDGMVAAFFALALPAIEQLTGRKLPRVSRPLIRKIASQVGITDVILLKSTPEGFMPLSTGEITLTGLTEADALAFIPAESEGLAAGSPFAALPLDFLSFSNPIGVSHP